MTSWELIFLHSKVNDGFYDEARLPDLKWAWPRETWLQERLRHLRKLRSSLKLCEARENWPARRRAAREWRLR